MSAAGGGGERGMASLAEFLAAHAEAISTFRYNRAGAVGMRDVRRAAAVAEAWGDLARMPESRWYLFQGGSVLGPLSFVEADEAAGDDALAFVRPEWRVWLPIEVVERTLLPAGGRSLDQEEALQGALAAYFEAHPEGTDSLAGLEREASPSRRIRRAVEVALAWGEVAADASRGWHVASGGGAVGPMPWREALAEAAGRSGALVRPEWEVWLPVGAVRLAAEKHRSDAPLDPSAAPPLLPTSPSKPFSSSGNGPPLRPEGEEDILRITPSFGRGLAWGVLAAIPFYFVSVGGIIIHLSVYAPLVYLALAALVVILTYRLFPPDERRWRFAAALFVGLCVPGLHFVLWVCLAFLIYRRTGARVLAGFLIPLVATSCLAFDHEIDREVRSLTSLSSVSAVHEAGGGVVAGHGPQRIPSRREVETAGRLILPVLTRLANYAVFFAVVVFLTRSFRRGVAGHGIFERLRHVDLGAAARRIFITWLVIVTPLALLGVFGRDSPGSGGMTAWLVMLAIAFVSPILLLLVFIFTLAGRERGASSRNEWGGRAVGVDARWLQALFPWMMMLLGALLLICQ